MARINIPTDPTEIISLAKAIFDQRTALGEKTPLGGSKWDKIGPDITQAGTFDNEADRLRKESEQQREKRDNFVPVLTEFVRRARDILSGRTPLLRSCGVPPQRSPALPPAAATTFS